MLDFVPSEIEAIRRAMLPVERQREHGGTAPGKRSAKVSQSVATRSVDKIGAFGGVSGRTVEKIAAVVARPGPPLQIAYRNSEKRDPPMVADATKKFRAGVCVWG
jgi:hypothetical protein